MKVSKLIEELQKYPQNSDVVVDDNITGFLDMEIKNVEQVYGNVVIRVERD